MSVVIIEEKFQGLRHVLATPQNPRWKLFYLQRFLHLLNKRNNPLLIQSYYQELLPYFIEYISSETLKYHSVDFLLILQAGGKDFKTACPNQTNSEDFTRAIEIMKQSLARTYFYLGEWRSGFSVLYPDINIDQLTNLPSDVDNVGQTPLVEQLGAIVTGISHRELDWQEELGKIVEEWKEIVSGSRSDRVWSLLTEHDSHLTSPEKHSIGIIQPLAVKGTVRPPDTDEDLILFNNRSISLNDMIYQQAQDSLAGARKIVVTHSRRETEYYKLVYSFPDKISFYTGDSLGLGLGLLNLAVLSGLTGQPYRYRLQQDLAVTGSLDILGTVRPIGEQSLKIKLETAFFSPLAGVVLPEKNKEQAERIITSLSNKYPQRYLRVHLFAKLKDCIHDSAIIIREKVPLSRRVITRRKKHLGWVAALAIIPVLLGSLFLLMRDTNPAKLTVNGRYLHVLNRSEKELWHYDLGAEVSVSDYKRPAGNPPLYVIKDLNGDSKNEVVVGISNSGDKEIDGSVFYFTSKGKLVWRYHDHPRQKFGNEVMDDHYNTDFILPYDFNKDNIFELVVVFHNKPWYPCRLVVMNLLGEVLEEYWNSGYIYTAALIDIDKDNSAEIVFGGSNNDYDQAILGVLEYGQIRGHSPQDDPAYIPEGVEPGRERYYLRFPKWTSLLSVPSTARMTIIKVFDLADNLIRMWANSGLFTKSGDMIYRLTYNMRVVDLGLSDGFYSEYFRKYGRDFTQDFSRDFIDEFFRKIEFWDGEHWVTEPTENKYWRAGEKENGRGGELE